MNKKIIAEKPEKVISKENTALYDLKQSENPEKFAQKMGLKYKNGDLPISEKFYSQEVSLPIYYSLSKKNILKITKLINNFVR